MNAPSADDGRPWHFVVIKKREKLNAIMPYVPYLKKMRKNLSEYE